VNIVDPLPAPPDSDTSTRGSESLFARATPLIPGGVNSPVRAFRAVGGTPRFIDGGRGSRVWDVDANELVDYICSWGALILGHAYAPVVEAISEQASRGVSFGAPTRLEVAMGHELVRLVPSLEMVRMVNSGTEATMAAVRLARGVTGRPAIVKFEGCYHGHADSFLVKAGSGAATFGSPNSAGVTDGTASDTLVVPYNDLDAVRSTFARRASDIACVIVEPVAGNMGVVAPRPGFLEGLRELCSAHEAVLIFDEVMTGFRVAAGGAQARFGVTPDVTTLGKVIGGGLPVGAFGGSRAMMEHLSPIGPVYQAGTLSGNPLAMAAGLATLAAIGSDEGFYAKLEALGRSFEEGVADAIARAPVPCHLARVGSMWTLFFTEGPVENWSQVGRCDTAMFGRFFQALLSRGVMIAPSQFEANFISAAHSAQDIDVTVRAISDALRAVA
jgi:glutamate-1-semialdehyde 2,1-aminomutase